MAFYRGKKEAVIVKNNKTEEYLKSILDDISALKKEKQRLKSEINGLVDIYNQEVILLCDTKKSKESTEEEIKTLSLISNQNIESYKKEIESLKSEHFRLSNVIAGHKEDINLLAKEKEDTAKKTELYKENYENTMRELRDEHNKTVNLFDGERKSLENKTQILSNKYNDERNRLLSLGESIVEKNNELSFLKDQASLLSKEIDDLLDKRSCLLISVEAMEKSVDETNSLIESNKHDKLENARRAKELSEMSTILKAEEAALKSRRLELNKKEQTIKEAMKSI